MNRKYSLKKNKDIALVLKWKKVVSNAYYIIYYRPSLVSQIRFAFSVSKKIGNAVTRNYERRVMKEVIRPFLEGMKELDCLMVVKKEATKLTFHEKKQHILFLIEKLAKKKGEKND